MKLIAIIIVLTLFVSAGFIWQIYRGLKPSLSPPPQDIAQIIETNQSAKQNGETIPANTTDFPLTLPKGFSISIFAKNLPGPRVMAYDPQGNLLVSLTGAGKVVALPDKDKNGIADQAITVIDNLNRPHGLAFRCKEGKCELYIAESHRVGLYSYNTSTMKAAYKKKIAALPDGGGHFTRTLLFMPAPKQDTLLISVGSSCNVCAEKDWRRAKILTVKADGSSLKVFADGLRNAVFMAAHPGAGKIWVTEMGRDLLGDDVPPDEINIIEEGKNYGWPYCYGKNVRDVTFQSSLKKNPCGTAISSHIDIPAHSAPLGLAFFPKEGWPKEYWYNLLVAYHGSWNRSVPTGYKIVRYKLDEQGRYMGQEDFISGWLTPDGKALGRPVGIIIQPNGIIYISDDKAGVIYRVIYQ